MDEIERVRASQMARVAGSVDIAAALEPIQFPISKQDLIVRLGDARVDVDDDVEAPLAEIVRGISLSRFGDLWEAQREMDARWTRIAKAIDAVERGRAARESGHK